MSAGIYGFSREAVRVKVKVRFFALSLLMRLKKSKYFKILSTEM